MILLYQSLDLLQTLKVLQKNCEIRRKIFAHLAVVDTKKNIVDVLLFAVFPAALITEQLHFSVFFFSPLFFVEQSKSWKHLLVISTVK